MKYGDLPLSSRTRAAATEIAKFEGTFGRETDKAIQFTLIDMEDKEGNSTVWFPLSHVKEMHRTKSVVNGTNDVIVVTAWMAKQKGLG